MDTLDRPDINQQVVGIQDLNQVRVHDGVAASMQLAFDHPELGDVGAVQKAMADLLKTVESVEDLDTWPAFAIAVAGVFRVLKRGMRAGGDLEELLAEARRVVGA